MFACLILGDSLALGTGPAVNARLIRPCEVHAAAGAGSRTMTNWLLSRRRYGTAILSVGSNDDVGGSDLGPRSRRVATAIARLRGRTVSARVIWLLPYDRARAYVVRSVAATFGDEILDLATFPSLDGIHPLSYRSVAQALLR